MSNKTYPVVEIFGPTIQGEGVDQGAPCHFVRFGGCDFGCVWCDTPHAVVASEVRKAERLTTEAILARLDALGPVPHVILSGGNPALHDLAELVAFLQDRGIRVAVETQGTVWKNWLHIVDRLCVSPKPPSSKQKSTLLKAETFIDAIMYGVPDRGQWFVKVVVFDEADLEWAEKLHKVVPENVPFFLSAGNDAGRTVGQPDRVDGRSDDEIRLDLVASASAIVDNLWASPLAQAYNVRVQSQYHVLLWGNRQGV